MDVLPDDILKVVCHNFLWQQILRLQLVSKRLCKFVSLELGFCTVHVEKGCLTFLLSKIEDYVDTIMPLLNDTIQLPTVDMKAAKWDIMVAVMKTKKKYLGRVLGVFHILMQLFLIFQKDIQLFLK